MDKKTPKPPKYAARRGHGTSRGRPIVHVNTGTELLQTGRGPTVFFVSILAALLLICITLGTILAALPDRTTISTENAPVYLPFEGAADPLAAGKYPYRTAPTRESYLSADAVTVMAVRSPTISATQAVVVEAESNTLLAGCDPDARIYPASMTKIMTLIVACDRIRSLEDTLTLDKATYERATRVGSSVMGVDVGDILTIKDLLYAVALRSAGDAVYLLTDYLAGSEEAFVELMNRKVETLGLTHTHFANATGLHDEGTYSTAREIAAILAYAMENEFIASLLCEKAYVTYLGYYDRGTYKTYRMTFYSTLFRDRLQSGGFADDPAPGYTLLGGKTGFTDEAKYCLATVSRGTDGKHYIVVTAGGSDKTSSVTDYMALLTFLN